MKTTSTRVVALALPFAALAAPAMAAAAVTDPFATMFDDMNGYIPLPEALALGNGTLGAKRNWSCWSEWYGETVSRYDESSDRRSE